MDLLSRKVMKDSALQNERQAFAQAGVTSELVFKDCKIPKDRSSQT